MDSENSDKKRKRISKSNKVEYVKKGSSDVEKTPGIEETRKFKKPSEEENEDKSEVESSKENGIESVSNFDDDHSMMRQKNPICSVHLLLMKTMKTIILWQIE